MGRGRERVGRGVGGPKEAASGCWHRLVPGVRGKGRKRAEGSGIGELAWAGVGIAWEGA